VDALGLLASGFAAALTPANLGYCLIGVMTGTLIGVLPGIGPVTTMALLLPATYGLDPTGAIIMLAGIYYGSQYGGSTTSILVNIPGEIGSIVTLLDGYQMARQGRAGAALAIAAVGSCIGGTLSIVGLIFLAPMLARLAIAFGPPEFTGLIVLGLLMVSYLGGGSAVKATIMATAGVFVSTIGMDPVGRFTRFTGGSTTLLDGVGLVPVSIGMFGLAEVLANVHAMGSGTVVTARLAKVWPSTEEWLRCRWTILRSTVVGFILGILPGAGVVLTTFFAYVLERRLSKHPERFGHGAVEGVAAPETANNAATAGVMVPLLALGVPPNLAMAMLLGAFVVHGIQPGPYFFTQHAPLFWAIVASMFLGNVLLLILNLPLVGLWVRLLRVPYTILFPLIVVFCFIGTYTQSNSVVELFVMLVFGLFGYAAGTLGYPAAPFLLGMVLGPMLETNLRQSLLISQGDFGIFVTHPIAAALLATALVVVVASALVRLRRPPAAA
jgi:putative tricarboxylic transport membrane protein